MSLLIPNHHPINPDGLVLWLDYLNTGSVAATGTWKDYSGNGNDGTLTGDTYVDEQGAHFDGTADHVDLGSLSQLSANGEVSVLFGFEWDGSGATIQTLVALENSIGLFRVDIDTSVPEVFLYLNNPGSGNVTYGNTGISANTPYTVCLLRQITPTYRNALYINGTQVGDQAWQQITSASNLNAFGRRTLTGSFQYPFSGRIWGGQIYDRPVADSEIQLYSQRTLRA